jgi:hypothetical protein
MKSIARFVSLVGFCALSAATYAALNMQEGFWETTLVTQGKTMPGKTDSTSLVTSSYDGDTASGTLKAGNSVIVTSSKRVGSCSRSSFAK